MPGRDGVARVAGGVKRGAPGEGLPSRQEVTVGLVGPHALLERIVLAAGLPSSPGRASGSLRVTADGADDDSLQCRLLAAAYADEQEAPDKVRRLGTADACLFASPAPLEYARRAGVLHKPAVHIHLADGPLIAALARAAQAGYDPGRASFDTFSRLEAMHALAELGMPARRLHVREEIATPAATASYHCRLWQLGQTSVAVTCLDEVARRLTASQVPAIEVQPTDHAIASALRTAILLAERHALTAAQLTVAMVEVPELRDRAGRRASRQAREELRLAVHGFLVHEARQIQATVSPVSEHGFLMIATRGSLAPAIAADGELQFQATAAQTLGVSLDVGIGIGRTESEAEEAARKRLTPGPPASGGRPRMLAPALLATAADPENELAPADSMPAGLATAELELAELAPAEARRAMPAPAAGLTAVPPTTGLPTTGLATTVVSTTGLPMTQTRRASGRPATARASTARADPARAGPASDSLSWLRSLETLTKLAQKLAADDAPVVDAELTGRLLSVTPRTARRQLRAMADQGLALPLPPRRNRHAGRPRQAYRLVVEELSREPMPPASTAR